MRACSMNKNDVSEPREVHPTTPRRLAPQMFILIFSLIHLAFLPSSLSLMTARLGGLDSFADVCEA